MAAALKRAAPDLARMGIECIPPNSNKRKEWRLRMGDGALGASSPERAAAVPQGDASSGGVARAGGRRPAAAGVLRGRLRGARESAGAVSASLPPRLLRRQR